MNGQFCCCNFSDFFRVFLWTKIKFPTCNDVRYIQYERRWPYWGRHALLTSPPQNEKISGKHFLPQHDFSSQKGTLERDGRIFETPMIFNFNAVLTSPPQNKKIFGKTYIFLQFLPQHNLLEGITLFLAQERELFT